MQEQRQSYFTKVEAQLKITEADKHNLVKRLLPQLEEEGTPEGLHLDLCCVVCLSIGANARPLRCCNGLVCSFCMPSVDKNSKCPNQMCSENPQQIVEFNKPVAFIAQFINQCKIKCPEDHCQQIMTFGEFLETDHATSCLRKTVQCPNGCGSGISSEEFNANCNLHFDNCGLSLIACEACKAIFARQQKNEHDCVHSLRVLVEQQMATLEATGAQLAEERAKSAALAQKVEASNCSAQAQAAALSNETNRINSILNTIKICEEQQKTLTNTLNGEAAKVTALDDRLKSEEAVSADLKAKLAATEAKVVELEAQQKASTDKLTANDAKIAEFENRIKALEAK